MQFDSNIPCGSRIMSIFTDHDQRTNAQQRLKGCCLCQLLDNVRVDYVDILYLQ